MQMSATVVVAVLPVYKINLLLKLVSNFAGLLIDSMDGLLNQIR